MKINKYPDGTSYVQETNPTGYTTFKINTYEDLWHLNQYVDAYNNFNKKGIRPTITIPNLIDAQADKRFNVGESSGLKLVCNFLNSMNADFKIFHPHNAEVVEALIDNVEIIDNCEFVSNVLSKLNDKDITPTILLPDGGAFKWGAKLADKLGLKLDVIAAVKNRKFVDSKSILTQQLPDYNFEGKDVLIIDDICVYGGTFKGLSKLLKERNCGKLYLAVSHMTVQNLGQDPVTNYFDKVFCTNSKFDEYFYEKDLYLSSDIEGNEFMIKEKYYPENLEIIKLF
jgi:ribose-phosphate pyrophosphokinase